MTNFFKLVIYLFITTTAVRGYNPSRQTSMNWALWHAHISPEILNELKDFQHLIPAVVIDEIVAEHYVIDGNFRTAFKYLRSQEFTQLQRQLLNLPEVIDILEFLHLTSVNATTRHMGATATELTTTDNVRAAFENDNNSATTTNTGTEETFNSNNKKTTVHNRPQASVQLNSVDDGIASSLNLKQALVRIVLLENAVVKTNSYDVTAYNEVQPYNSHQQHLNNNYHHHHHQSLGTFTSFVAEVLQHLPHAAYQNMIEDKCRKNAKFAEFYQALRSQDFKPLVEQTLRTPNIEKVIRTLSSHDVDVAALKPIAFQVISWGPNI